MIESGLINVYSRYGVREIPKPRNLLELIGEIARYNFLRKPAATIAEIRSGIPDVHSEFWRKMSIGDFYAIYKALQASPAKVLAMLNDVSTVNQSQDRVYGYLLQYVGNMREDEVRNFLRFVTGSAVCSSRPINVTFNSLDGLARRPLGYTCNCTLELPITYVSYHEFITEFKSVLENEDFAWQMNAI